MGKRPRLPPNRLQRADAAAAVRALMQPLRNARADRLLRALGAELFVVVE
ncbi:uncharacterized protein N7529_001452 [Penicillium soppii]|jgi:hypothetical protein|nr:uncharacterized protein N7529_001452 [Penicillium soppii]KAJ5875868.1 hypothetical protein N7529_001452 [Penicillium soppii]